MKIGAYLVLQLSYYCKGNKMEIRKKIFKKKKFKGHPLFLVMQYICKLGRHFEFPITSFYWSKVMGGFSQIVFCMDRPFNWNRYWKDYTRTCILVDPWYLTPHDLENTAHWRYSTFSVEKVRSFLLTLICKLGS